MNKKVLSALLALLTVSGIALTSCSSGDNDKSGTTTSDTTATDTTAVTTEAPEYIVPEVDYDGKTFTIAASDRGNNAAWKAGTYCEADEDEQNGDIINDSIYERNLAVEEELNVKIAKYPIPALEKVAPEMLTHILANDHVADMAFSNGSALPNLLGVNGENLIDIYTIDGIDLSHSWWNQNAINEFDIFGHLYAVTGDISLYTKFAPMLYFFNKTVAENFNLGDMYEMVRDGEWTFDKLVEMCNIVSVDLDGDGLMTTTDAYGLSHQLGLLGDFLSDFGMKYSEKDSDGVSQLVLNNDRTASAIEKVVPFLNNDQITVSTSKFTDYNNIFFDLHLAMFKDNRLLFNYNQLLVTIDMRDMETDFGIIPSPKFDEAQDEYYSHLSPWWATFLVVPITNSDLEFTGIVSESLGYHSQQIIAPAYMDVTVLDKTLRDTESEEMVNLVLDIMTFDLARYFNWGGISSVVSTLAHQNSTNFASAWAANEEKIQAAIDATFEGWAE